MIDVIGENICANCPRILETCTKEKNLDDMVTFDELLEVIKISLQKLYKNDFYLIQHKVHEMAKAGQFFKYFSTNELFKKLDLNVDIEYNKNGNVPKYIYGYARRMINRRSVRPDLIVHKRGCNHYNLLYIEFKFDDASQKDDFSKLSYFTLLESKMINGNIIEPHYKYKYGLFINIKEDKSDLILFVNGDFLNLEPFVPNL